MPYTTKLELKLNDKFNIFQSEIREEFREKFRNAAKAIEDKRKLDFAVFENSLKTLADRATQIENILNELIHPNIETIKNNLKRIKKNEH